MFSHCVFLTFDRNKVEEILVFSRDELVEVASKPRKKLASYRGTNLCVMFRFNTLDEARSYMQKKKEALLDIEVKLHKHPEEYKNRWDKIPR